MCEKASIRTPRSYSYGYRIEGSSSGANDRSPYSACGTRRSARQEHSDPATWRSSASRPAARTGLRPSQTTSVKIHAPLRKACPGFESEEHRKVSVIRTCHPWDAVHDRECHDERDQTSQPQLSAAAAAPRAAWRAKPEGFGESLASETCAARARAVRRAARNCQIRPACETQEQRLHHRHVPVAGEPVGERRRNEPGRATPSGARQPPRPQASPTSVLRNLYHRRRAVSRKPLVPLLGHFSGLIERG